MNYTFNSIKSEKYLTNQHNVIDALATNLVLQQTGNKNGRQPGWVAAVATKPGAAG